MLEAMPGRPAKPRPEEPETEKYRELFRLFRQARADPERLEAFIEECRPLVRQVIKGSVHEVNLAEDLCQEALINIFRGFKTIRGESASQLVAFIVVVANNITKDYFRGEKNSPLPFGLPGQIGGEGNDEDRKEILPYDTTLIERDFVPGLLSKFGGVGTTEPASGLVERAIRKLNPEHRQVIQLHYFEEKSLAEIAEIIGVPEGTVKSRLARAREQLERFLTYDLGLKGREWKQRDFWIYHNGEILPIPAKYSIKEDTAVESARYLRLKYPPGFISARHALAVFQKGPKQCSNDERILAGLFWATTQSLRPLFGGSWGKLQQLVNGAEESAPTQPNTAGPSAGFPRPGSGQAG